VDRLGAGLLGSRAYVAKHFADRTDMVLKPEHAKLAAYFNMDNGGGAFAASTSRATRPSRRSSTRG
jgi:hypothetical protein